jgi:hypothetical protein
VRIASMTARERPSSGSRTPMVCINSGTATLEWLVCRLAINTSRQSGERMLHRALKRGRRNSARRGDAREPWQNLKAAK